MNTSEKNSGRVSDPFNLERFVEAQADSYARALVEVSSGRKQSHWMWYIFPQLRGLGHSATATHYGIRGAAEARAFLAHDVLGPRLIAICEAALNVPARSATAIFGQPDDMKLRSCATLFASVSPPDSVFGEILDRYFDGNWDEQTLERLKPQA